jgi:hypothetical protein
MMIQVHLLFVKPKIFPILVDLKKYYAELTPETNTKRMETWGIGSCVGLVLTRNGKQILAHVDYPERLASLEYEGHFEKAVVVLSLQSSKRTAEAVIKFAREHADTVEVQTQQSYFAKIGVDAHGNVYVPDKLIKGVLPEIPPELLELQVRLEVMSGAPLHKMPLPT